MPPYDQTSDPGDESDHESREIEYLRHCNEQARYYNEYENPGLCQECGTYFAIENGLCQFCEAVIDEGLPSIFEGFSILLTNHAAFADWEDENEPRIARA